MALLRMLTVTSQAVISPPPPQQVMPLLLNCTVAVVPVLFYVRDICLAGQMAYLVRSSKDNSSDCLLELLSESRDISHLF